jgi:glycosyltransferase involved in cell wall biosynthesis
LKIAIIYPETLPSDKARTVTVVKTAASLGEIAEVTLICEDSTAGIDDICSHYGVQKSFSLVKLKKELLFLRSNKLFNFNLLKHLHKNSYDAIYVRHLKTAESLLKNGFDVIFEVHEIFADSAPEAKKESVMRAESFVYKNAAGIVFISQTLKDEFEVRFGKYRSVVLPLALNGRVEGADKKEFLAINEVYYIGSFQAWKGVDTLIESAKYLKSGAKIKLVGSGAEEVKLREMADEMGVADKVDFVGRLTHSEVKELLASKTRICVLPNKNSAFDKFTSPLKLFEYMASFNAVIASDIPSIKEIIGGVALEFKAGDAEDLGAKLNYLLENPTDAKTFAQAAYNKIAELEPAKRSQELLNFLKNN